MPEIKFKGKRVDNSEWVYGYFAKCIERGDNGCPEHLYAETETELYYILDEKGNAIVVFPETVGQRTGLQDENGVDIYEGDILKIYGRNSYGYSEVEVEVIFERLCFMCGSGKSLYNYSTIEWAHIEIIGNIHDAKEEIK